MNHINEKYRQGDLSDDIIDQLLSKMQNHDHRYLDADLFREFTTGGLSKFREHVISYNKDKPKHEKLAVLLRGNGNEIIIYFYNHKVWELSYNKTEKVSKVSFDYDHARFSLSWSTTLDDLLLPIEDGGKYGFRQVGGEKTAKSSVDSRLRFTYPDTKDPEKKKIVNGGTIGTIVCQRESFDETFVKETFEFFKKYIDSFFDKQTTDYFRETIAQDEQYSYLKDIKGNGKSILLEKRWQHRLFFEMKNMQDGYYAYDLEFSQPYPNKKDIVAVVGEEKYESKQVTAEVIKKQVTVNEPDILALKFVGGEPVALAFIEVKCTADACDGNSGINKHLKCMDEYTQNEMFMKHRKKDAYESLLQYKKMGFISDKVNIPELEKIDIEKMLILTKSEKDDGAIGYFRSHRKEIEPHLKGTKVICIDDYYNADEIVFC